MGDKEKKLEAAEGMEKMDLNELDQISGGDLGNVVKEDLQPLDPGTSNKA